MPISFAKVLKHATYSRNTLAKLWGYAGFHAIARGVVTPRDDNKIILFVTEEKQATAEQYKDRLSGIVLELGGSESVILRKTEWPERPFQVKKFIYFIASVTTQILLIAGL